MIHVIYVVVMVYIMVHIVHMAHMVHIAVSCILSCVPYNYFMLPFHYILSFYQLGHGARFTWFTWLITWFSTQVTWLT